MKTYRLGAVTLNPLEAGFQKALAEAYKAQQRPVCGCRDDVDVPLYIAKMAASNTYVLRRMPGEASRHVVGCDHFEPPAGLSGLAQVQGHAIIDTAQTETVELKLDFALFSPRKGYSQSAAVAPDQAGQQFQDDYQAGFAGGRTV
ncbi:MAG: DUF1173 family protein [Rhodoferax sp.]|nr:DUF1173 family protein [Rhodoferax sp.]